MFRIPVYPGGTHTSKVEYKEQEPIALKPRIEALEEDRSGRGDFCIKRLKIPRVTHGEDLCKHSHESLMGRIYAKHATSYSWGGFMQSRFA